MLKTISPGKQEYNLNLRVYAYIASSYVQQKITAFSAYFFLKREVFFAGPN